MKLEKNTKCDYKKTQIAALLKVFLKRKQELHACVHAHMHTQLNILNKT